MKERDFKSLEYNKIKEKLNNKCITYIAKNMVDELKPFTNIDIVKINQKETTEAVSLILRKGVAPLFDIPNFDDAFAKVNVGAFLNTKELLQIANVLYGMRKLKNYFKSEKIDTNDFSIIKEYFNNLYSNQNVEDEIFKCIKAEDIIDDRASKTLYDIRRQIRDSETKIKEKLNSIIKSNTTSK